MPRPGPRPYECVRRAWHSDRHQPMRGSLIQEIFRIANEVHGPSTRKNKEWQEKLPIVVFKAEEIMYSKANSEAEYMDLKTLWDRANDAIDTIIRRDDTPESGDLLQPCIEAALNLGCIPRRASRSQRHSNPGFYLGSSTKEEIAASPKFPDSSKVHLGSSAHLLPSPPTYPNNPQSSTQSASWYPVLTTAATIESGRPQNAVSVTPDTSHEQKDSIPFSKHDYPSNDALPSVQDRGLSNRTEIFNWPNLGRVYPLCYIKSKSKMSSQPTSQTPKVPLANSATIITSHVPSINGIPTKILQNFLDSNNTRDASHRSSDFGGTSVKPSSIGYDLSLRLGLPSPPSLGEENTWTLRVEDVESSCYGDTTDELFESCSSKGSSEAEGMFHIEASDRKRRAPIGCSSQDAYICWNQNISRHQLFSSSEAPEL